jgi:hypothetical protein
VSFVADEKDQLFSAEIIWYSRAPVREGKPDIFTLGFCKESKFEKINKYKKKIEKVKLSL